MGGPQGGTTGRGTSCQPRCGPYGGISWQPGLHHKAAQHGDAMQVEKNEDELIKIIVSEHGKVYEDAKGSLTRGLEVVEYACGIPQMLKGEFTENVGKNVGQVVMEGVYSFESFYFQSDIQIGISNLKLVDLRKCDQYALNRNI